MAYSFPRETDSDLEFSTSELTGALGDSVTVLPLIIALAATTSVSLPHVLVGFGVFQIIWGLYYGMPLSVEPMKALVGLAIVGSLSYPEFAAAGLLAGGVLLVVGKLGLVSHLERVVGEPVIRGVQFAVALLLLESAVGLSVAVPPSLWLDSPSSACLRSAAIASRACWSCWHSVPLRPSLLLASRRLAFLKPRSFRQARQRFLGPHSRALSPNSA